MRFAGWVRVVAGLGLFAGAQMLTGCGAFFVCQGKASCPTTTTSTTTGDYAFVSNNATNDVYLNAYVVSSGTLVSATGSPDNLGIVPQAMAVTPSNGFLYAVGQQGGIYGWTIGTGGAITVLNSGLALANDNGVSICISPDGKWLFSLQAAALGATSTTVNEYAIQSSGGLTIASSGIAPSSQNTASTTVVPTSIKIAPSGNFLAVDLGVGGVEIYGFSTSTGTVTVAGKIGLSSATSGIYAIGIDANNYLYAAGTVLANNGLGVVSYLVSSAGVPAAASTSNASISATSSGTPTAIEFSSKSTYVYVASYVASTGAATIAQFSTANGVLTALSPATVNGPTQVAALGHDASGNYLVAAGHDTNSGIQIFSISSGGILSLTNSVASATTTGVPATLAMSH